MKIDTPGFLFEKLISLLWSPSTCSRMIRVSTYLYQDFLWIWIGQKLVSLSMRRFSKGWTKFSKLVKLPPSERLVPTLTARSDVFFGIPKIIKFEVIQNKISLFGKFIPVSLIGFEGNQSRCSHHLSLLGEFLATLRVPLQDRNAIRWDLSWDPGCSFGNLKITLENHRFEPSTNPWLSSMTSICMQHFRAVTVWCGGWYFWTLPPPGEVNLRTSNSRRWCLLGVGRYWKILIDDLLAFFVGLMNNVWQRWPN